MADRDRDDYDRAGTSAVDRLTYLLIGAGIGATVALLFAPKSGRELRGDIADASRKGIDYTKQGAQVAGQRATELYGQTTQKAHELYGASAAKAQELVAAGRDQITSRKDQFNAAIDAGREAYKEEKNRGASAGAPALGGGAGEGSDA